jgi:hypothetical protein
MRPPPKNAAAAADRSHLAIPEVTCRFTHEVIAAPASRIYNVIADHLGDGRISYIRLGEHGVAIGESDLGVCQGEFPASGVPPVWKTPSTRPARLWQCNAALEAAACFPEHPLASLVREAALRELRVWRADDELAIWLPTTGE